MENTSWLDDSDFEHINMDSVDNVNEHRGIMLKQGEQVAYSSNIDVVTESLLEDENKEYVQQANETGSYSTNIRTSNTLNSSSANMMMQHSHLQSPIINDVSIQSSATDADYDSDDMSISDDNIEANEDFDTSDTSSNEDLWYNLSDDMSSESSLAEYSDNIGFFELMNQHLEIFNHEADSFFRVSLRTLYETLMEYMREKGGPTPQDILDTLPTVKVTLAQLASKTNCPICYAEYELEDELLKLPCNHFYHKTCITNWLKLKSTCPTCRLDLTKDTKNRYSSASSTSSMEENTTDDVENPNTSNINTLENITSNRTVDRTLGSDNIADNDTEIIVNLPNSTGIFSRGNSMTSLDHISSSSSSATILDDSENSSAVRSGFSGILTESLHRRDCNQSESSLPERTMTAHTKLSTTLSTTITKRFSRETEIW